MSEQPHPAPESRRSRRATVTRDVATVKPTKRRRKWPWIVGGVAAIVLVGGAACAYSLYSRAMDIQSELTAAQRLIPSATASVANLDIDGATVIYEEIAAHTAKAASLTDDPLWRAAENLPWAGITVAAVSDLAAITDDAVAAAEPIITVAPSFMPENLKPVDGAFPVDVIASAAGTVSTASSAFSNLSDRVVSVNTDGAVSQVVSAKAQLVDALASLDGTLDTVDTVVSVLPTILGVDGEKRYLLVFQNNAEALGLGGSSASQTLVTAREGKVEIAEQQSSQTYGQDERVNVELPDSAFALYGEYYAKRINLTPSRPDWPSDAQILKAFWQRDIDPGQIDGVVSLDPLALARMLEATGPVSVAGTELNSSNAVSTLLHDVYARWDSADLVEVNQATDAFFAAAANAVFDRLSTGEFDMLNMLDAFGESIDSGSLMYWTDDPAVSTVLNQSGSRITGVLPIDNSDSTTVGVYFRDTSSSKIDYFMDSSVDVATACADGQMTMTVTATLRLDLTLEQSVNLPSYVRSGGWKGTKYRTQVFIYAPPGMEVTNTTTEGKDVAPFRAGHNDLGRTVAPFQSVHAPGDKFSVTATFTGPVTDSPVELRITPMVRPATVAIADSCN